MLDVKTMVDNVLTKAGTNKISRLNILDHGNPRGGYFGKDWLTPANLKYYEPILRRLKGKFTEGGIVHLQHCNIGQNRAFMRQLSAILGVDIVGGTGLHNPVYRFNWGDYVRCNRLVCGVTWRP
jgi:hypothetical protein